MKYIFLLNKFSLKDELETAKNKIEEVAKRRNLDYEIRVNSLRESTEDIIREYNDPDTIILPVGGDGSINRGLNSIVNTKNILGYIPYGTGNDFDRANKELLQTGVNDVDVVRINEKYFINIACFGIDADIANAEALVHSDKENGYNKAILGNILKARPKPLKVTIGKDTYDKVFTTVAVCNGRYYGAGRKIGTNALLDDGLVDVYLVNKMNIFGIVSLMAGMNKGKHNDSKAVRVIKCKKLFVESPTEITCNIDGDQLSSKTFDIEVIHKGIKVYYDRGLIDEITSDRKKRSRKA